MCAEKPTLDINASIQKHIAMLKPIFPLRAVISIGDYSSQLLLKELDLIEKNDDSSFFILKIKRKMHPNENQPIGTEDIHLSIDEKADTHYWFNVQQYIAETRRLC